MWYARPDNSQGRNDAQDPARDAHGAAACARLGAAPPDADVRFATFNASLNRNFAGQLVSQISTPDNVQAKNAAETIQRVRPDVLLINEFDFDAAGTALRLFQDNYLSIGQSGAEPIFYPYRYTAPSNTGVPSGFDLDNSGSVGGPNDAFGFGFFAGQFGMAFYSMHPIDPTGIRTFQTFLWKDMPGNKLPDDPATPAPADWYSPAEQNVFRLSSKSHSDLPILVGGKVVHLLTRRRCSTAPRIGTARATTTRFASGPTTSRPGSRTTSTTTAAAPAA